MTRTTLPILKQMIDTLNRMSGSPTEGPYKDGVPQVGHYFLQGAYGGWQVQRITASGGCYSVTSGYRSKREIYDFLRAFMDGYIASENDHKATQVA
jgi:hypothetical protein